LAERFAHPRTGAIPTTWGEAIMGRIGGQNVRYRSQYPYGHNIIGVSDSIP
jgi:hypothetical protein